MTKSDEENLLYSGIAALRDRFTRKEVSPVEVVELLFARLERLNPLLNCFLCVCEEALSEARRAEAAWNRRGARAGRLSGVPFSVKDLILTSEMPTSGGSRLFGRGLESRLDSACVQVLKREGAILIGKNHLHEFAYGITNENEHYGPCRNPWDTRRVSGGSSGGSAVAVAVGLGCFSIGTDTRGSVRIPSACCGVTGLKPTRRSLSTRGVLPLSRTLDHVGPLTRSVEDARTIFELLSGRDLSSESTPVSDLKIAVFEPAFGDLPASLQKIFEQTVNLLTRKGLRLTKSDFPLWEEAHRASRAIVSAEAMAVHDENLRKRPEAYGKAVRSRLEKGRSITALEYLKALEIRRNTMGAFHELFKTVDCLVCPGLPVLPPAIGSGDAETATGRVDVLEAFTRLHSPQNVAGIPAMVLPCGFTPEGMPASLQLTAARGREEILFRLGEWFQSENDLHLRRPPQGG